jgi:EAL domain-containing protein (putative c-di-GMP-specific phosphodiesterase class I)
MQDLTVSEDGLAIVKAAISLGRSLGMATTAEGVETEDQLDAVRREGCTEVQGYFFSPPLPPSGAAEFLARMAEGSRPEDSRVSSA